tara:strand:+ start:6216 stop:7124 length:909 start_codon:yes stop_codon:yes gene_type:complete
MSNNQKLSVGIIIPTLNAEQDLENNLKLIDQNQNEVLIVDSYSSDRTLEIAKKYNCAILMEDNFNHGLTRERARKVINKDIVVFLTQDAYIKDQDSIDALVAPIKDSNASISYGRQVPRVGSSIFESFPVYFNYPKTSNIRSIEDIKEYGVYTFFCSDNFGAYLNCHLDEIGGFEHILTGEDYFACSKLLLNGKKVAYVSDAVVEHSHSFTLLENFRRYFDTGLVRGERPYIQNLVGHANKRGAKLTKLFFKEILDKNPNLIFYAFFEILSKYIGFKLGFYGHNFLPFKIKKLMSNQKYFFS